MLSGPQNVSSIMKDRKRLSSSSKVQKLHRDDLGSVKNKTNSSDDGRQFLWPPVCQVPLLSAPVHADGPVQPKSWQ